MWYKAPEMLFTGTRYGEEVDLWSVGTIMAEMLLGQPLFKVETEVDLIIKILSTFGTPSL